MPDGSDDGTTQQDSPPIPSGPPAPDNAPAQSGVADSPADAGDDAEEAALDAAYDRVVAGRQGQSTAARPAAATPAKNAPPATAGATTDPGTTPDASATAQPDAPDADARQLLQRFKVKDSTFAKLDPDERVEFLANLKQRQDAQAQLYQENQQLKAQRQPPPAAQQQAAPAKPADALPEAVQATLDECAEQYGVDSPVYKSQLALARQQHEANRTANERAERAEKAVAQWEAAQRQQEEEQAAADTEAGLKAVPRDAGVNLDQRTAEGKGNREKLVARARLFLQAAALTPGWNPKTYGWQHAIADAFPQTFKAQNALAQRQAAATAAKEAARHGVDPGGRPNRSKPQQDDDSFYDGAYDALKQGRSVKDVAAAAGR